MPNAVGQQTNGLFDFTFQGGIPQNERLSVTELTLRHASVAHEKSPAAARVDCGRRGLKLAIRFNQPSSSRTRRLETFIETGGRFRGDLTCFLGITDPSAPTCNSGFSWLVPRCGPTCRTRKSGHQS
jgi:hypothetical protein